MNESEQRFSNQLGEEYDLFNLALPHHSVIQQNTVSTILSHFPDKAEISVLEIGFGTGITSRELLSQDDRVRLTSLDNEPIMLKYAQQKLSDFSSDRYELIVIDALDFLKSQNDNSYDAVVSVWVLHNLHHTIRSKIVSEIYRILKPRGIFVNGDKIASSNELEHQKHLQWQIEQFDIFDKHGKPELKIEWTNHYLVDEHPERILFENDFINELEKIGFKDCTIDNRNYMDAIASAIK